MKKLVAILLTLFCGGAQADIPVLMYHSVDSQKETTEWTISRELFSAQISFLKKQGYTTLTIRELTDIMNGKMKEPKKAIAITFDDGWKSVLYAAEVLKAANMSATFFIISNTFNYPDYLNQEELIALASNNKFEIGAHSHTHYPKYYDHLSDVNTGMLVGEALISKQIIEQVINKSVTSLAWPYGYTNDEAIAFVTKMGFTSTSLVTDGVNVVGNSPSRIKRLNVDGRCDLQTFQKLLTEFTEQVCKQ